MQGRGRRPNMAQSTSAAAVNATPRIVSERTVQGYRDIKASGAPPAVRRCWRAIVERLPDDGPAEVSYRAIAGRARCGRRTAMAAVSFGVAIGCLARENVKLDRYRGDYWNAVNRYTWIGSPPEAVKRGQFRAFVNPSLARAQGATLHPEEGQTLHPKYVPAGRGSQNDVRRTAGRRKAPTTLPDDDRVVEVDWTAVRRRVERKNGRRATDDGAWDPAATAPERDGIRSPPPCAREEGATDAAR